MAFLSHVLVVNAGSTSLKLSVVDTDETSTEVESLADPPVRVDAVGHRVVHGGPHLVQPVLIDDTVLRELEAMASVAPLHNAPAREAIDGARVALPDVPHVAVFDTAFHATLPGYAVTYAVPADWRERLGVRRYGFHGLAVAWAAEQLAVDRLVVCHLGGGCSVSAVLDGRSADTTMGLTPLEGVPMATRSGSVDPGALLYLLREHHLTLAELDRSLEHDSGLEALGGLDAPLAFQVFTYRVAQAAASMAVALGGLDVLAFSGGVGENRPDVREAVAGRLRFLGDFRTEVVHAREDVMIARGVRALLASR
jgi:acetate kinase